MVAFASTVGIDVSKRQLDGHVWPEGASLCAGNTGAGFATVLGWLTEHPVEAVGVNPPGDAVYSENELDKVLNDGSSFKVKFSGSDKGCTWNIKVTWADDNSSSFFKGLDLCTIETVTLKYDRKSDTASYVAK